jgi:DNA-binding transcriptional ArsR family regulator
MIDAAGVARARSRPLPPAAAVRVAALLGVLADPVRLRLVWALDGSEEMCVGDLALTLVVSADSVTYALRLLRSAGMVRTRKQGTIVYNSLTPGFTRVWRNCGLGDLVGGVSQAGGSGEHHPGYHPEADTSGGAQIGDPAGHCVAGGRPGSSVAGFGAGDGGADPA